MNHQDSTNGVNNIYQELLDETTAQISIIDAKTYKVLYANKSALDKTKTIPGEYIGSVCYEFIHSSETPCQHCMIKTAKKGEYRERIIEYANRTYKQLYKIVDWNGSRAMMEYTEDVTEQVNKQQMSQEFRQNLVIAMNHAKMLYWEYNLEDDTIFGTDIMQKSFGISETMEDYPDSYLKRGFVAKENVEAYKRACASMKKGRKYVEFDARIRTLQDGFQWMRIRMSAVESQDSKNRKAICTAERIAEYKDLEQRFNYTLRQNHISSWRFDLSRRTILLNENTFYDYNYNENNEIGDIPESQIRDGLCYPDDVPILRRLYSRMYDGERFVEEILRFKDSRTHEYRWKKCSYTVIVDADGNSAYAIGSAMDIEEQVEAQRRYKEAVEYKKHIQVDNLLIYGHSNISQDKILEITNNTSYDLQEEKGRNRSDYINELGALICDKEKKKEFEELFSNESMLHCYDIGVLDSDFTCEISLDGIKRIWVTMHGSRIQSPDTGELEGFFTMTNITQRHIQEKILNTVLDCDYDYVAEINFSSDSIVMYFKNEEGKARTDYKSGTYYSYSQFVNNAKEHMATNENAQFFVEKMKPENVKKHLENNMVYEFICHIKGSQGQILAKRARFASYDKNSDTVIFSRTDVTEIMHEEEEKREQLSYALDSAKQAAKAKTDFLSRMSHDLRTPMNAIIGLTALTIEDADKAEIVQENMTKMRSASNFMLGLINDILDMAKIESGEVTLMMQPYAYRDFVVNMRTMFEAQCKEKNIQFIMPEPKHNPVAKADKIRINQIFFNIISNAVKYTPNGGKITYAVKNLEFKDGIASGDAVISDTGIGMSEEFQKRMFEPFMQESNRVTPELQGTGLGLSITKQLVEKMGGSIRIDSKKNCGTTVTIHLQFEVIEMNAAVYQDTVKTEEDYDSMIAGKTVLLAEDHPLNAQIVEHLLEKKNVKVYHAQNGKIAVEKFAASEEGFFDMVLMDIRMPEMDGYQACDKIRKMNRKDAKTIPIVAMTANAYAEDIQKSMEVGMNAHLAKPVDPQLLYETIAKLK